MESMVSDNFWTDRRVFVTGASGLLGGWLIKDLLRLQADVIVLLRDWVPNSLLLKENLLNQVTVVRGDLSDANFLERILAEYEIQTIFHLAAQTIVPIANVSPLSTFQANIEGTWNLLEAARRCPKKIGQIIIASSDKAYGEVTTLPYREDTALQAQFPYDVSKACADMLGICYAKTWGLPVAITRCGNFFGGGDLNWNRIVPGTIRQLTRGKSPIIRSSGKLIRDYIYVEDAANAYMTLARKMADNPALMGQAFNFSNGLPMNVLQLTEKITASMQSDLEPTILNEASGEIEAQYLDSTKARESLQWQPRFGVDEGLKHTISWYQAFFTKEPL
jgi:CDP-glucose 4,6-dehydratase